MVFGFSRESDPQQAAARARVDAWAEGRASVGPDGRLHIAARQRGDLALKVRRAYAWISERAIHCDNADLEVGDPVILRGEDSTVELRRRGGWASFVLLPLLGLMTRSRILFIGAPGRGKTTVATLMALLAGGELSAIRRGTQRGHPQLTVSDLLGSPLPGDLVRAQDPSEIRVAFRRWLTAPVKIVDEFNRLPTKTQSALLSLMAEGCAEVYEQVVYTGKSAWFLTANDELGGGTFQVIDALKDRIDACVRAVPFAPRHIGSLATRVERGRSPEEELPEELVFSEAEIDRADAEIRGLPIEARALASIGAFSAQIEFCRRASDRVEHMNKDTLHVAGRRLGHVCNEDCPLDKGDHICAQTESGLSARAQLSLIRLAKAFAWFRGAPECTVEDVRLMLPWVMHERIEPAAQSEFFHRAGNDVLLSDRASWLTAMFEQACARSAGRESLREPLRALEDKTDQALRSSDPDAIGAHMAQLERSLSRLLSRELDALVHEDVMRLRAAHARCRRRLVDRRGES